MRDCTVSQIESYRTRAAFFLHSEQLSRLDHPCPIAVLKGWTCSNYWFFSAQWKGSLRQWQAAGRQELYKVFVRCLIHSTTSHSIAHYQGLRSWDDMWWNCVCVVLKLCEHLLLGGVLQHKRSNCGAKQIEKILSSSDPHPEVLLWHSVFILTFYLTFYSGILSGIYSDILSDMGTSEIWRTRLRSGSAYWHLALVVEVRQCKGRRRRTRRRKQLW